jgi:predicted nucleic acid-binding Zn ribbon protein
LPRIDPEKRLEVYRIWTFWDEEVGETIGRHARPAGCRGDVLSVRVDSHSWMQELQFLKPELIARLNRRLGRDLIRDIYFVSGSASRPEEPISAPAAAPQPAPAPVAVPRLRDPRLAKVFERIASAHARRRAEKKA